MGDKIDVDAVARQPVQRAVIGRLVDAPEPGVADLGGPGTELAAKQPEQCEHRVGVGGGVCHDFGWTHWLLEKSPTRAWRSLISVKDSAKPERVATSIMTSGRSIFGMRAEMVAAGRRGWTVVRVCRAG